MATRVILISLDSFLHRHLTSEIAPRMAEIAAAGGFAPDGGRCDLPSVTYPSHASLLSGRHVGNHGVLTGRAGSIEEGVIPGWAGDSNVARQTIFELFLDAGKSCAAILGDHKLFQILNAGVAQTVWPPSALVPEGLDIDPFGYQTNAAIHARALAAAVDPSHDFVFIHYNETDTAGHLYGPDSDETLESYRAVDALVGEIADALSANWAETVFIVVSDHGMELIPEELPINLMTQPGVSEVGIETIDEAGASLLRLRDGVDPAAAIELLCRIDGVVSASPLAPGVLLVEAAEGRYFGDGPPRKSIKAGHGGPTTTATLALIGGGHPAVEKIAAAIEAAPPHLVDWAPTIAAVFGLELAETDGRDLAVAGD